MSQTETLRGLPSSAGMPTSPLLERVGRGVIGEGELMDGPFGPRRVTYAVYTASGRSQDFIEDFIREEVLPRYANTHTESCGSGATAAVNKLIAILELRIPAGLDARYQLTRTSRHCAGSRCRPPACLPARTAETAARP